MGLLFTKTNMFFEMIPSLKAIDGNMDFFLPITWLCTCALLITEIRYRGLPGGSVVKNKNTPAIQETQVRLLGQEDPLEKKMSTHSSILAWEVPWTEETGGLQSMGL